MKDTEEKRPNVVMAAMVAYEREEDPIILSLRELAEEIYRLELLAGSYERRLIEECTPDGQSWWSVWMELAFIHREHEALTQYQKQMEAELEQLTAADDS